MSVLRGAGQAAAWIVRVSRTSGWFRDGFTVKQAPSFDGLAFDHLSLLVLDLPVPEVNFGGCEGLQSLADRGDLVESQKKLQPFICENPPAHNVKEC